MICWIVIIFLALIGFVLFCPIVYTIDAKQWKLRVRVSGWCGIIGKSIVLPPDKKEADEPDEDIHFPDTANSGTEKDGTPEPLGNTPKYAEDRQAENNQTEEAAEPVHDDSSIQPEKPVISYTLSPQEDHKNISSSQGSPSFKKPDFPESHDTIEEMDVGEDESGLWDLIRLAIHNGALELVLSNLERLARHGAPHWVIEGDFGTGDPAETGMAEGLVQAAFPTPSVRIRYHYTDQICSVRVHAKGRVLPCVLAWIVLRVLLSRPVRELWHARQGRLIA